ncbi:MAG: hypothetical protein GTO60_10580, partial [Gammaproteobacteria bacterium]|nr:hypothetical protein [Gammaproteobacteria bacterium]
MKRKIYSLTLVLALTLAFAVPALADIPAPPANQQVGIPDGIFNSLAEADCRLCHGPTPLGRCSISDINCTVDADCLATETCVAIPVDTTYLADRHHLLVGTPVPDPTDRPFPDGDTGGNYDCFSCHDLVWDPVSMTFVLETFRDCTFCHVQDAGES